MTDPLCDSPHHRHFGHPALAEGLADRIRRHFAAPERVRPVEKALVIGVFGEWGSGKSTVLDAVGRLFECTPDQVADSARSRAGTPAPLTVPVAFNPWRFEKEAHLIVPLLKVTEAELQRLSGRPRQTPRSLWQRLAYPLKKQAKSKTVRERLSEIGSELGNAVVGIASALEGTAEIPLPAGGKLSVKCSPKAFVDVFRQGQAIDSAADAALSGVFAAAESMYFDFPVQLQRLTEGNAETASLNLLFLIDDLDRCLPDKAVELLESIKLFFDVPRCAFVLALDDEVIERGVMHRYRDYFGKADAQAHLPITGAEYLEKIIHLPVRLPMLNRAEAEDFLLEHYPGLFSRGTVPPVSAKGDEPRESGESRPLAGPPAGDVLLDLYLSAVPRLPRKLQRAAELLEMTLAVARARSLDADAASTRMTLARLVILQLFAPDLYRFGRRQVNFLARLQEWHDEDRWRKLMYLESDDELKKHCEESAGEAEKSSGFYSGDPLLKQDEVRLRRLVVAACMARTGFHVRDLLHPRFRGGGVEEMRLCFELFMSAPITGTQAVLSEGPTAVVDARSAEPWPSTPYGRIENPDRFLSYVLAPTESGWQQAVAGELEAGVVPDDVFERLLEAVCVLKHPLPVNPGWLETLLPVLTEVQAMRLYEKTRLLERLHSPQKDVSE